MSDKEPENNNLISFIATTVETMRDQMVEMQGQLVKKGDLDPMREEIAYVGGQVEAMRDQMATKTDLPQLEDRLSTKIEVEVTAVRGDIEQIHLRLDSIDRALRARLD